MKISLQLPPWPHMAGYLLLWGGIVWLWPL